MNSILSVATAATDLSLLSPAELRVAVGLSASDGSQDAELTVLGPQIFADITRACRVRADGATPPTLRKESLAETFRPDDLWMRRSADYGEHDDKLILSRRPIVTVTSVVENGVTLTQDTDFSVDAGAGILNRLNNDQPMAWMRHVKIVVNYDAGWATVPEGLKRAVTKLLRNHWFQNSRDPALKSINVPGVIERSFWIDNKTDPAVPQDVIDMLGPYINLFV